MKKKIFVLLAAFIVMLALPAAASAKVIDSGACGEDGDNVTWTLDDSGTFTISGTGAMADYMIVDGSPWYRNENIEKLVVKQGVTKIGREAFYGCENLSEVEIPPSVIDIGYLALSHTAWDSKQPDGPVYVNDTLYYYKGSAPESGTVTIKDGIKYISSYAFSSDYGAGGFYGLKRVVLPESVEYIGKCAFAWGWDLESVNIPGNVKSIGDMAFYDSRLTEINISNDTSIGDKAFAYTDITTFTIPGGVNNIGTGPFDGCKYLTEINVDKDNSEYVSVQGVLFDKSKTKLIQYPAARQASYYSIPENVVEIGDCAFAYCDELIKISIHNRIVSIGDNAFADCKNLTDITIPNSVQSIGTAAFYCCESIENIVLPNRIKEIAGSTFTGCNKLKKISIPISVTRIGGNSSALPGSWRSSLTDIYYEGSEADWNNIDIGSADMETIAKGTIHYNIKLYEPIAPVGLTVTKRGDGYRVSAQTDYDGTAYAAVYDSRGGLIGVDSAPFADMAAELAPYIPDNAASIKFFVWTNMLQPVTLAENITLIK